MDTEKHANLIELLEWRAQNSTKEITFLKLGGKIENYSYRSIYSNALKVAKNIQSLGVPEGSVVALLLPTGFDFCTAFFGVQLAGCIPVSIYPPLKLQKISQWKNLATHQMRDVNVELVLTDSRIFKILGEPLAHAPVKFGAQIVTDLINISPEHIDRREIKRAIQPIAFLQFSSGTTGHSKAVAITHQNALTNADAILDGFQINRSSCVTVSWLPLYHDMGLIGAFISSIVADGKLYLMNPEHFIVEPLDWLKAISTYQANITVAPNFAYNLCSRKLADSTNIDLNLSHLQFALCGAEMIQPRTLTEFYKNFAKYGLNPGIIVPVYGLAEATLAVTFNEMGRKTKPWKTFDRDSLRLNSHVYENKNGLDIVSVGKPLKGVQIEIRNAKNQLLGVGIFGHIWIKSPSIMLKYYNNQELTEKTIVNGWLNTGDNGFIWDGELYICGRNKEVIIIRGQNYDPTLIERSLTQIPELREGCAVAFSAPLENEDTEDLIVISELKKGIKRTDTLCSQISKNIEHAIREDHALNVKVVDLFAAGTLPRTSSGKIKRSLCKKLWLLKVLDAKKMQFTMMRVYWFLLRSQFAHFQRRFKRFK